MSASSLDFATDGRDWPNRAASRFVEAAGLRWHVQIMGKGPALLLVHGTGASTHSFAALAPLLARHFRVVVPDLPGHAFTDGADWEGRTLPGMAAGLAALCEAVKAAPVLGVGHSAGAAVLVRMTLDGLIAPKAIIAINGAFVAFRGLASQFFSPIAKLLVLNPLVPMVAAWRASDKAVIDKLLRDTGSRIDPAGAALYARLAANSGHVAGALGMMAGWDLRPLEDDLPKLKTPLFLIVGSNDGTVSPDQAFETKARAPRAEVIRLRGLGHLAHEEKPGAIAAVILDIARKTGVLKPEPDP